MSAHALVTIVAEIAIEDVEKAQKLIDAKLRNPATDDFHRDIEGEEGDAPFLHFASLHALRGSAGDKGYLILEFSADGDEKQAIRDLADRAGKHFEDVFALAKGYNGKDLAAFWLKKRIAPGFGMFDEPGIAHSGTPGLSVADIRAEAGLSGHVAALVATHDQGTPLDRLEKVRADIRADEAWKHMLRPPPPPERRPEKEPGVVATIAFLLWPFIRHFAWPLLLVTLLFSLLLNWPEQWVWTQFGSIHDWGIPEWTRVIGQVLAFVLATLGLVILFSGIALGALYLKFRRAEATDWLSERAPDDEELGKILARENQSTHVQNHMVSHTVRKPGWLRRLTSRLAFFIVAKLTSRNTRPGFLGNIGTIHFARWITIPGTRDLIFFSNYGGSWESYLEDFITKAHDGLTAVWSNTVGFPRSKNLFQDGATDGERFKRYARQSMVHTPFWYCAYPTLSTANIRANREIRRGLAAASGETEAAQWLSLFGSQARPHDKLETSQMQSLLFGGMGFKPEGRLLLLELSDNPDQNRELVAELMPNIAFGDGRYYEEPALITFAPTYSGLEKLGLPLAALETFPHAFREGMTGSGRDRILGDIGPNAPTGWSWGNRAHDIALLVYGKLQDDPDAIPHIDLLDIVIEEACTRLGSTITDRVELATVGRDPSGEKEPFGFVDGVSQPAMRGTYRGLRNADPIHLVEPGEIVLGYPDNRGNIPPAPTMDAQHDPEMRLPVAGASEGFAETRVENPRLPAYNGSFLVIRQLQQHVDSFGEYCAAEGVRIKNAFPEIPVTGDMKEFVGAKLIGRWKDGSSLVRNPYISATELREKQNKAAKTIKPDNDFLYGTEDPQALACPFGSHIRRTNPRDSLTPGSDDQIAISNRHRILRVGRGYLAEDGETTAGIMFMCLNADIERQFEFVQQTWMRSTKFHGLTAEADALAVNSEDTDRNYSIPTRRGPVMLKPLPQFVTVRGGGYFFLPGRQLLEFIAKKPAQAA